MTSHSNSDESSLPPLRFEHVKIAGYKHFLVLDGFRGPVCDFSSPAIHPNGWAYFDAADYNAPHFLKGCLVKIIKPSGTDNGMWRDTELVLTDDSHCEIASKAFEEYVELSKTCGEIKANRYPEAVA